MTSTRRAETGGRTVVLALHGGTAVVSVRRRCVVVTVRRRNIHNRVAVEAIPVAARRSV